MEGSRRRSFFYNEILPFILMASIECSNVVLNTIFKAATMNDGLSFYVFVTYSYCVAALVLFPYNFIYRRKALPPIRLRTIGKCFLLSMVGSTTQISNYRGIDYSSPTLCSALSNLVPAFTFILAIIFRMERFACRSFSFQAKVIGTVISISGAFIVIFYKGIPILFVHHKSPQNLEGFLHDDVHQYSKQKLVLIQIALFLV